MKKIIANRPRKIKSGDPDIKNLHSNKIQLAPITSDSLSQLTQQSPISNVVGWMERNHLYNEQLKYSHHEEPFGVNNGFYDFCDSESISSHTSNSKDISDKKLALKLNKNKCELSQKNISIITKSCETIENNINKEETIIDGFSIISFKEESDAKAYDEDCRRIAALRAAQNSAQKEAKRARRSKVTCALINNVPQLVKEETTSNLTNGHLPVETPVSNCTVVSNTINNSTDDVGHDDTLSKITPTSTVLSTGPSLSSQITPQISRSSPSCTRAALLTPDLPPPLRSQLSPSTAMRPLHNARPPSSGISCRSTIALPELPPPPPLMLPPHSTLNNSGSSSASRYHFSESLRRASLGSLIEVPLLPHTASHVQVPSSCSSVSNGFPRPHSRHSISGMLPLEAHQHHLFAGYPPGGASAHMFMPGVAGIPPSSSQSEGMAAAMAAAHADALRADLDRRFLAAAAQVHHAPHGQLPHVRHSHQDYAQVMAAAQVAAATSLNSFAAAAMLDKYKIDPMWRGASPQHVVHPLAPLLAPPTAHPSLQNFHHGHAPHPHKKPGRWCSIHVKIAWLVKNYQDSMAAGNGLMITSNSSSKPPLPPPLTMMPFGSMSNPLPFSGVVPSSTVLSEWSQRFAAASSSTAISNRDLIRSRSRSPLNAHRRPHQLQQQHQQMRVQDFDGAVRRLAASQPPYIVSSRANMSAEPVYNPVSNVANR